MTSRLWRESRLCRSCQRVGFRFALCGTWSMQRAQTCPPAEQPALPESAAVRCSEGVHTGILPRSQGLRSPTISTAQRRLGTAAVSISVSLTSCCMACPNAEDNFSKLNSFPAFFRSRMRLFHFAKGSPPAALPRFVTLPIPVRSSPGPSTRSMGRFALFCLHFNPCVFQVVASVLFVITLLVPLDCLVTLQLRRCAR